MVIFLLCIDYSQYFIYTFLYRKDSYCFAMTQVQIDDRDEQLRTELMEAILEYLEGMRSLRSVLQVGITVNSKRISPNNPNLAAVASQINAMGNEVANDKKFSREYIKETFTSMLEKLTRN